MNPAMTPIHVLIKPIGAQCNLRCDYCFYLEKSALYGDRTRASFRMSEELLETTVRRVIDARAPGQQAIEFAWQGGEPSLMGIHFFEKAVALQRRLAPEGLRVSNSFQTNGVLIDDAFARFFREHDFLVGVSIDGPQKRHDRFRRDPNGNGSFTEVMAGIEALNRHGVEYNLLTVVQSDNADHPEEVYSFLSKLSSSFIQFIPIVEQDPAGTVSARSVSARQWGEFLMRVFHMWRHQDIGRKFVQLFEMMLGITLGHPASLCVHARTCGRALALEHNGDLYSCDHFVDRKHLLGNIGISTVRGLADGEFQGRFGRDKYDSLPDKCRACSHLRYCYGGCPKDRLEATESGWLNWLCDGYSCFYRESGPFFVAMAEALRRRLPASDYRHFIKHDVTTGESVAQSGSRMA